MTESTTPERRLAALAVRLAACGLKADLRRDGVHVKNPHADGCCEAQPIRGDTITCRSRADDGGRLWFFTSWAEPITEANDVIGAVMTIQGYLARREPSFTEHTNDRPH